MPHGNDHFRLGSFNVRSLYAPGRLNLLKEDVTKFKLDVLAVQETWWENSGSFFSEDFQVILGMITWLLGNLKASKMAAQKRLCALVASLLVP